MTETRTKKSSLLPVLITMLMITSAVAVGVRMTTPGEDKLQAMQEEWQTLTAEKEALTGEIQGLKAAVAEQKDLPQAIQRQVLLLRHSGL